MQFRPVAKHGTDEDIRKILLLNYPGCKTIAEALEKQKRDIKGIVESPIIEVIPKTIVEIFNEAVKNIASYLDGYDIDLMDQQLRFDLSKMPLNTIPEINLWRETWSSVGKNKVREQEDKR